MPAEILRGLRGLRGVREAFRIKITYDRQIRWAHHTAEIHAGTIGHLRQQLTGS